jgi:hypothetical protein
MERMLLFIFKECPQTTTPSRTDVSIADEKIESTSGNHPEVGTSLSTQYPNISIILSSS